MLNISLVEIQNMEFWFAGGDVFLNQNVDD